MHGKALDALLLPPGQSRDVYWRLTRNLSFYGLMITTAPEGLQSLVVRKLCLDGVLDVLRGAALRVDGLLVADRAVAAGLPAALSRMDGMRQVTRYLLLPQAIWCEHDVEILLENTGAEGPALPVTITTLYTRDVASAP
jgi:hypothetical protein